MPKTKNIDFDSALTEVGEFGRFQQILLVLLAIPGCLMNAYICYALVFLFYTPEHTCSIPPALQNHSMTHHDSVQIVAEKCELKYIQNNVTVKEEKCSEWDYDNTYFTETFITKFGLVCDRAIEAKVMLSVISAVTVAGCLFYSYVSDRWGRKIAFELNVFTYMIGGTVSLFMPNPIVYTAVRLIASINCLATFNICYIWILEFTGPSKRTLVTMVMCIAYAIGCVTLSVVAYFCRTWIEMGLVTTLPFCLLFVYHWIVDESPRWLLSKGRNDEVQAILEKMVKRNGTQSGKKVDLSETMRKLSIYEAQEKAADPEEEEVRPPKLIDLFERPNLRKKTVLVTMVFFACAVLYTTIAFNVENMDGVNLYLTWALQAFVEAPACLINLLLLNRFGRIFPLSGSAIAAGILCLSTVPAEFASKQLVVILAVFGKLFICMTYAIIYQLGGELFPTVVRGLGIGFGSVVGHLGNISMPYIIYSARAHKAMPMIIMGLIAIVGGFVSLFLPETKDAHLPQTLIDGEQFGSVGPKTFVGHFRRKKDASLLGGDKNSSFAENGAEGSSNRLVEKSAEAVQ